LHPADKAFQATRLAQCDLAKEISSPANGDLN
jgi:hypothetical protein